MTFNKTILKLSLLSFFIIFTAARYGFSQNSNQEFDYSIFSFGFDYGANVPLADLGERFGFMNSIGAHFELNTKSNWIYGVNSAFYFGSTVKEDVLSNLRTGDGVIIGNDQVFADIFMRSRVLTISGSVGKLIPIKSSLPKTGFFINAGAGIMVHKVRIQDDSQSVPQVLDPALAGYDRLTAGMILHQQFGFYSNEVRDKHFKFYMMLEANEGFTEGLRTLNYSTNLSEKGVSRLDMILSFKIGLLLPIRTYGGEKFLYY